MDKRTRKHLVRCVHQLADEARHALNRVEEILDKGIVAESCGDVARATELLARAVGEEALAFGKLFAVVAHSMVLNGMSSVTDEDD